jgi:hypothetical protein
VNPRRWFRAALVGLALCALPSLADAQQRAVTPLPTVAITTARTAVVEDFLFVPRDANALSLQAVFTYGSGGTTAKAWVQTSLDGGLTWIDIANFAFTTSSLRAVNSVRASTAVAANYTATDGTLSDNTIKDGILGDRIRIKWTTTGTYAATTLKITAVFQ